jgi:drug/metabolite transporter (DMT)-like permease
MGLKDTVESKWFWCMLFCLACWGPWALFSKLGSIEIPPLGMQFLFTIGGLPVAIAVLIGQKFKLERSRKGILYGLAVGLLSAAGTFAFFGAYHSGGNASVITTATGLYPMVTVILAVLILHERLTRLQILGLGFATAAFIIFSLG